MHNPSRQQFLADAAHGNLVPVYREIMADGDTPVSAYAKLGRRDYSFLLESVVGGQNWAAYSFIGVSPRAVFTWRDEQVHVSFYDGSLDGRVTSEKRFQAADPTAALAQILGRFIPVETPGLPRFWGGAVGWIGYDVVRAFESLSVDGRTPERPEADEEAVPELCMVITDTLVIFDNLRQTIKVVATADISGCSDAGADANADTRERRLACYDRAVERVDAIVERLRATRPNELLHPMEPPAWSEDGSAAMRWGGMDQPVSTFERERFIDAVGRIRDYILAGDVFQTVLSQRLDIPRDGLDLFDVYRALRVINPSPYMYHLQFPEAVVTGASPETLVRCADGRVEVRPIAGTRPRGATPAADDALAAELLADPKERAEHLMLVDLGRNDVGRISSVGTVEVTEFMVVERYSHVMHLTSHVRGQLADGYTWRDVLRAAFPAGTLSGAPKVRAMQIIDELEPVRRGLYGGAVGYVSYSGNMDVAIAIRTLVSSGDVIHIQAGAGIVHDSDAALEYEETLNKARGILRALALARAAGSSSGPGDSK